MITKACTIAIVMLSLLGYGFSSPPIIVDSTNYAAWCESRNILIFKSEAEQNVAFTIWAEKPRGRDACWSLRLDAWSGTNMNVKATLGDYVMDPEFALAFANISTNTNVKAFLHKNKEIQCFSFSVPKQFITNSTIYFAQSYRTMTSFNMGSDSVYVVKLSDMYVNSNQ